MNVEFSNKTRNHYITCIGMCENKRRVIKYSLSLRLSHVTTDSQSVSRSWCPAPSGAHDQMLITVRQFRY
jgi:hypothetical protein